MFSSIIINIIYIYIYISSIGMITSYNPIYSILFMINIFVLIALNLILLEITYLGIIFIMIYVGAIIILFLFIIMMIPLKKIIYNNTTYISISFYFLFFLFYLILKYINKFSIYSINYYFFIKKNNYEFPIFKLFEDQNHHNLMTIGNILFNYYYIYLFIIGFILLLVMISSIFLTSEQQGKLIRKQFNTSYRHSSINIYKKYF